MSNLLVQNIKHTNNTTAITVDSSAQMTVKSDGGATTTSLQQGLAKVWTNNSASAIVDSFNTSGFTDNGTGDFTTTFSNNMNNTTYSPKGSSPVAEIFGTSALATSSLRVNIFSRADSFSSQDQIHFFDIHGDLA